MNNNICVKVIYIWLLMGMLSLLACQSPDAPAATAADGAVITYQREGGLAGLSEEWQIFSDGRIIGPDKQEMRVPHDAVAPLFEPSVQRDAFANDTSYISKDACCDQYIYTITFSASDNETTLRTSDAANHPQSVTSLISNIEGLLSLAQPIK